MRGAVRALAAALLAAFGGAIGLALVHGCSPALRIDFDVTPPRGIVDGVYSAEFDSNTGQTFAWTGETLTVDLIDIDRQVEWDLDVRVRARVPAARRIPNSSSTSTGRSCSRTRRGSTTRM